MNKKLTLAVALFSFVLATPFMARAVAVTWDFSSRVLKPLAAVIGSQTSIGTTTASTNTTLTVSATSTDTTTVLSLLKSTGASIFSALVTGNVGIGTTTPYALLSIGGNVVIGASAAGGTLGDFYLPKLGTAAGTFIAVDETGKVIATSTTSGVTSVTGTYPVASSGGTTPAISLAFGTTTSNTWANTQVFTNAPTIATFAGLVGANGGVTYAVSTSTLNIGGNAATVTTNANLSGAVTSSGSNVTSFGSQSAGVLGTAATGVLTMQATSTLYGAGGIPNSALFASTISGISLGGTLANLTATDGSLTFSGTYTGATARTIGLNVGNANTWTALQQFNNASSTQLTITASGRLYIPAGANPTIAATGDLAINTTAASSSLRYFDGTAERVAYNEIPRTFTFASSTVAYYGGSAATTTIPMGTAFRPETWTSISCYSNAGTGGLRFGDGTNFMEYVPVTTTTGTFVTLATNNTFIRGEKREIQIRQETTVTRDISCSVLVREDAD